MTRSIYISVIFIFLRVNVYASDQTTLFGYYLNTVTGNNMSPAIETGDRIYSIPDFYNQNDPRRGDIVLFSNKATRNQLWVSRIIGLPGENVSVSEGNVYINGKLLTESYVASENNVISKMFDPGKYSVPDDGLFLIGDNRDNSKDSRFIGFVKISEIEGKVQGIYLSRRLGHIGELDSVTYP